VARDHAHAAAPHTIRFRQLRGKLPHNAGRKKLFSVFKLELVSLHTQGDLRIQEKLSQA
jgi:hypothetical protein